MRIIIPTITLDLLEKRKLLPSCSPTPNGVAIICFWHTLVYAFYMCYMLFIILLFSHVTTYYFLIQLIIALWEQFKYQVYALCFTLNSKSFRFWWQRERDKHPSILFLCTELLVYAHTQYCKHRDIKNKIYLSFSYVQDIENHVWTLVLVTTMRIWHIIPSTGTWNCFV